MGVWVLAGELDGGPEERAILVDSVTMRPILTPLFECRDDAENFLQWFLKEHGDPRGKPTALLEVAHAVWVKHRCEECYAFDCSCPGCGNKCDVPCDSLCEESRS